MPQAELSQSGFKIRGASRFAGALLGGRLMQAASLFVMARLLSPAQMGVVAILTVTYLGLFHLTNLGFDRYIVYAHNDDPADWHRTVDAVWVLQLVRGGLVLLASVPGAWLLKGIAGFGFTYPQVIGVALSIALLSFTNPELSSFERNGNFSIIANARALSMLVGSVVTVGFVYVLRDPMCYVGGQVAAAAVMVGYSFIAAPRIPSIRWEPERVGGLFAYTKHLLVISVVSFLSAQFQNIYVGWAFGPATLGFYFIWLRVVTLPSDFMTQLVNQVVFAKASDSMRRREAVSRVHVASFAAVWLVLGPFFAFVWFHGDRLIAILASVRWLPYWWVGKYFVLITACYAVSLTISPFMLVTHAQISSRLRSAEVAGEIALTLILGRSLGVTGVLVALLVGGSVAMVGRIFLLYRLIIPKDGLTHARKVVLCLAVSLGGPLAWEGLAHAFLPSTVTFPAAAAAYAAYLSAIATVLVARRDQLMAGFSN